MPSSWLFQNSFWNRGSVALHCVTSYCCGVSLAFSSGFSGFLTDTETPLEMSARLGPRYRTIILFDVSAKFDGHIAGAAREDLPVVLPLDRAAQRELVRLQAVDDLRAQLPARFRIGQIFLTRRRFRLFYRAVERGDIRALFREIVAQRFRILKPLLHLDGELARIVLR